MKTIILQCTCHHEYQDMIYGIRKRVHNIKEKDKGYTARCTVCKKENLVK